MKRKPSLSRVLFDIFNTIFMVFIFIIMVYPFLYTFNYSISSPGMLRGSLVLLPVGINFSSYAILFSDNTILRALLLSISRSMIGPVGMMFVTGMGGYAISKKDLIFGKFFRFAIFFTMYFSAGIIPIYMLMKTLGLTNNYLVYILPMLVSPFNMVLVKTYIESLPNEIEDAIFIDGGTEFDAYFKIIFFITLPVNAAIMLFTAIAHWNSFMDVQLYNYASPNLHTLQYVLYNVLGKKISQSLESAKNLGQVKANAQSIKMAISVITIVPIMMLYPLLQKYFISGMMIGSIKA